MVLVKKSIRYITTGSVRLVFLGLVIMSQRCKQPVPSPANRSVPTHTSDNNTQETTQPLITEEMIKDLKDRVKKVQKDSKGIYYALIKALQDLQAGKIDVNADITQDRSKVTVLHLAAWIGHSDLIAALLKLGANVNGQDDNGDTPVMIMASRHKIDTAALHILLEAPGINLYIRNNNQNTVLDILGIHHQVAKNCDRPVLIAYYQSIISIIEGAIRKTPPPALKENLAGKHNTSKGNKKSKKKK